MNIFKELETHDEEMSRLDKSPSPMCRPDHPSNAPSFFSKTANMGKGKKKIRTLASVLDKKNARNHNELLENSTKKSDLGTPSSTLKVKNQSKEKKTTVTKGSYYSQTIVSKSKKQKNSKNLIGDTGSAGVCPPKTKTSANLTYSRYGVRRTKLNLLEDPNLQYTDVRKTPTNKKTPNRMQPLTPKPKHTQSKLKAFGTQSNPSKKVGSNRTNSKDNPKKSEKFDKTKCKLFNYQKPSPSKASNITTSPSTVKKPIISKSSAQKSKKIITNKSKNYTNSSSSFKPTIDPMKPRKAANK